MKNTRVNHKTAKARLRLACGAAALAALSLGATGCGAINQQATTIHYNASDGTSASVDQGMISVRNLMLVTNNADSKARFIGLFVNDTDKPATVSIKADGDTLSAEVKAHQTVNLTDSQYASKFTIKGTGKTGKHNAETTPGLALDATFMANGEAAALEVPVVDGTLSEYQPYVPGGANPSNAAHLSPTPSAEGGSEGN